MAFKELPFKEPLRSDFELIATRVFTKFPCARFYTNIEDGLSDTMPDFTISGVSNGDLETINFKGVITQVWVDPDELPGDGIYLSACNLNQATIDMCHYVELTLPASDRLTSIDSLLFNYNIKSDFELIMKRVLKQFPQAKIYTIPDADLANMLVYFTISGISKEDIKAIDLSDLRTPYCVEEEDIMKGGFYIHTCEMNDVTILDTGAVEVTML